MSHDAGQTCPCQSDHRPAPMELHRHHILPLSNGGTDDPGNVVYLCPTAHVNVHELLRFMLRDGRLWSWGEAVAFYDVPVNRYAYALACEGFRRIVAALT